MSEVKQVIFTDPAFPGNTNHETHIIQLIDDSPENSSIKIVMSGFDLHSVANSLVRAARRNVNVKLIIEYSNLHIINYFDNRQNPNLQIIPANGCFGHIHTKLFLFSETKINNVSAFYVAVAGSATMTEYSTHIQQNNIVIVDKPLYNSLHNYWDTMLSHLYILPRNPIISDADFFSSSQLVKAYMWPRSSDAVKNAIGNMGTEANTITNAKPKIKIAMARWSNSVRGKKLLSVLIDKAKNGVLIEIVSRRDNADGLENWIYNKIHNFTHNQANQARNNIKLYIGSMNEDFTNPHHKYFIYEGYYNNSDTWGKIVWTGSENWTHAALHNNDEIMIKCIDDSLYDLFEGNHNLLKTYCQLD